MATLDKKEKTKIGSIFDNFNAKKTNTNSAYTPKGLGKNQNFGKSKVTTRQSINRGNR